MTRGYIRVYTLRGRVAHLVPEHKWSTYGYPSAECGLWASPFYWRGTGSQEEYERAAALPLCQRCEERQ